MISGDPPTSFSDNDSKFDRDKFLVHQKMLSIGAKYYVYDEDQEPLFFVQRPALRLKAHIEIFDDDTKNVRRLMLRQDRILAINQHFTLLTPEDQVLCTYERRGLLSLVRRTWVIRNSVGQEIAQAREDSWAKAVFRRLFGWMRTDFEILLADNTHVGAFHRKFTIGDKYALDLTNDPDRRLDRRIAVGLAILLDTAEAR